MTKLLMIYLPLTRIKSTYATFTRNLNVVACETDLLSRTEQEIVTAQNQESPKQFAQGAVATVINTDGKVKETSSVV